jgi:hypothetical protein
MLCNVLKPFATLHETVNAINDAYFFGHKLAPAEKLSLAKWISARHWVPGGYANTFAGFDVERTHGIKLFTGEHIASASARHILGEEACRVLRLLKVKDKAVDEALAQADAGLMECMTRSENVGHSVGVFCCGKCTVGMWRNVLSGGLDRREERLEKGVKHLKSLRKGVGEWNKTPFWYAALALTEIATPEARGELKYAANKLESTAKRSAGDSPFVRQRHEVATHALGLI